VPLIAKMLVKNTGGARLSRLPPQPSQGRNRVRLSHAAGGNSQAPDRALPV